jgi:subtilase family serine protease
MVLIRTDVKQRSAASFGLEHPVGYGYGPSSLRSAYNLPSTTAGKGKSVAVVDAYNDPNAVSDVAAYRSAWGVPACNSTTKAGCLTVVNENGAASPLPADSGSTGWATEESLDVDMVSAICPNCHIYLVEASSSSLDDLGAAVNSAVSVLHVDYISNSYGASDSSSDSAFDSAYYNHPGVAVTASAGDSGYGIAYPAASKDVVAVGGTSLVTASNARGWAETAWNGTGSGCSLYEAKASWQNGSFDSGCTRRTNNDVSANADPGTGVAIYDTYDQSGWLEVGGTSESSPIIASVFALAGTPKAGTYPASYIYKHTKNLYDVTKGSNGGPCTPSYLCKARNGYDGPTGWGTPKGTTAFKS